LASKYLAMMCKWAAVVMMPAKMDVREQAALGLKPQPVLLGLSVPSGCWLLPMMGTVPLPPAD